MIIFISYFDLYLISLFSSIKFEQQKKLIQKVADATLNKLKYI